MRSRSKREDLRAQGEHDASTERAQPNSPVQQLPMQLFNISCP